ncbi:trimeric intracellular cation channel family protein [Lachnospiraceae bacterium OttesenSCG-928-E19]|nr:trimeric intracellular cation channel family protein [Lachnospiraceae bacterium OttesenSCG-928-E19]
MELASQLFHIAEWIGIIAFSISGAMLAVERGLDIFGVVVLGVITTLGGGIIRDVLLGETPPRFFYSYHYVLISAVISIIVFIIAKKIFQNREKADIGEKVMRLNVAFDAIGLGAFTITGVQAAMEAGYARNSFLCISLGVLTGVGGGMLRDIMSRRTPIVLTKHVYALAAVVGAMFYYGLFVSGMDQRICLVIGVGITVVIRLLANHYRWSLPKAHR